MRKSIFKKINEEGKLEIPEEFLKQIGINEGDEIEINELDGCITIGKKKSS